MASITVSGTLTINIEGLEEEIQKIEALKSKISATIRKMLERVTKVASADNWPDIQEGSEQLKKIYQAALNRIESKSDRIKTEINKVLDQIKQNESKVQSKFGELLVKAGQAIKGKTDTNNTNNTNKIMPKDVSPEWEEQVKNMSYKDKVNFLDNFNHPEPGKDGMANPIYGQSVYNSMSKLEQSLYNVHKIPRELNYNAKQYAYNLKNNSSGSIKNIFNSSSSILTDIKNRGNDIFLKIFGNNK